MRDELMGDIRVGGELVGIGIETVGDELMGDKVVEGELRKGE